MKTIDIIKTAIKNTFRSKIRTTLTVIAIFIGAFTLTLTTSVGTGVSNYIDNQLQSLGAENLIIISKNESTNNNEKDTEPQKYNSEESRIPTDGPPGQTQTAINSTDIQTLENTGRLDNIRPFSNINADYIQHKDGGKYQLKINTFMSLTDNDLNTGKQLDHNTSEQQIIIPPKYAQALNMGDDTTAIGKEITLAITDFLGTQHTTTATVVGIQNQNLFGGGGAAVNQKLSDTLVALQNEGIPPALEGQYAVVTATFDINYSDSQISSLKETLKNLGFEGTTLSDQLGMIRIVINAIIGVLNGFAIIALIAAAFGIINTLLMSVQERTREIGLMKAMGMSSGKIFSLFSFEAIFIGFLGSIMGVLGAIGLGSIINFALSQTVVSDLQGLTIIQFAPTSIFMIITLIMFVAFLSGTLPANKAAKQNPIDALRYE